MGPGIRHLGWRGWASVLLAGLALGNLGSAGYMTAKAELAQVLLERAWERTLAGADHVRPWSWADTWPVARLSLPGDGGHLVVLEGASGRNLAFGPAHVSATPLPGGGGNSVLVGHRDTHFSGLGDLAPGDPIELELTDRTLAYRVEAVGVVHESEVEVMADTGSESLTLVTCYPFDAINPGTEYRYVVRATVP